MNDSAIGNRMYKLLVFFAVLFIVGCASNSANQKGAQVSYNDSALMHAKEHTVTYSLDTVVGIGSGFEISCRQDEFSGNIDPSLLTLKHNGKQIYSDSSDFYVLDDSINPTLLVLGNDLFEVFLEVDNRPNMNYLKMVKIRSDKVIDSEKFPTFIGKPSHLFKNKKMVYAGFWEDSEEWTDSNNVARLPYNPILYYVLTDTGLVLDSVETIKKNTSIYGRFNGYYYDEKISYPASKINMKR